MPVSFMALATAWPDRFMYVWGSTSQTPRASDRPTIDCHRFFSMRTSRRRASSRTHAKPTLCLVSAYSDSGLPRPTIRCCGLFSIQTRLGPRRAPQTLQWSVGQAPHLLGFGRRGMVPTEQMEKPVHQEHGQLVPFAVTPLLGLGHHPRPRDRDITGVVARALERQDVGR